MSLDAGRLWHLRQRTLSFADRPLVMGIVNVTPDSFSDGGRHDTLQGALAHALKLAEDGADLLDIGGESTRPGSTPVPLEEEVRRVVPVVRELARRTTIPLSVDTSKAEVARQSIEAGAQIINDVTALADPAMPELARATSAGVILMHMQGTPQTMQLDPRYDDVVNEIISFFEARLQVLTDLGIAAERIVVDPGIGFGKTVEHNIQLLARLEELTRLDRPICLGVSRKKFFGKLLDRPVGERLAGSLAVACFAMCRGAAQILRVHDVKETRDAVVMLAALLGRARASK
jgi:dihydropteroate synthase